LIIPILVCLCNKVRYSSYIHRSGHVTIRIYICI
jgi:hypothetical protein